MYLYLSIVFIVITLIFAYRKRKMATLGGAITAKQIQLILKNFLKEQQDKQEKLMLHKEKIDILLALFAVRCAEISNIYEYLHEKQKEAKEGNWIELFLEDCLNSLTPIGIVMHGSCNELEKIENRNKEKAKVLSENNFYNCWGQGIGKENTIALERAIISYVGGCRLECIKGIKNYGFMEDKILILIEQHTIFDSISLEAFIYKNYAFEYRKASIADDKIKLTWQEIILSLKSLLILMQIKKDSSLNVEKLLKNINALEALESCLSMSLPYRNFKGIERRLHYHPEDEKLIYDFWKNHPIMQLSR